MKGLVLEYLLSGCFGDSAKAFAKEVEERSKEGQQITESEGKDQEIEENGMEGVEATPPPEDWAKDNEEEETVPTIEENGDDEDVGVDGLLSKDQMRDVRLRQGESERFLLLYPRIFVNEEGITRSSYSRIDPLWPDSADHQSRQYSLPLRPRFVFSLDLFTFETSPSPPSVTETSEFLYPTNFLRPLTTSHDYSTSSSIIW